MTRFGDGDWMRFSYDQGEGDGGSDCACSDDCYACGGGVGHVCCLRVSDSVFLQGLGMKKMKMGIRIRSRVFPLEMAIVLGIPR